MPNKPALNKDTSVCISLAGRPSNLGTRFHNFLSAELELDFLYKAFSTDDLEGAVRGVRALGIRGCSVSMPFKTAIIPLLDRIEDSAADIDAVNTVVNDDGVLTGSNTDVEAVGTLLVEHALDPSSHVLIRGSGSMASAVSAAFAHARFERTTLWARNAEAGAAIARRDGHRFTDVEPDSADVLVNVTSLGMAGADEGELAFDPDLIRGATAVFDVVALPSLTPLIRAARAAELPVITGAEVHALQAALQFERYTGVALTRDQVDRAHAFARSS
ncbi:shikimate 5-dehydrogenase [uncultured Amnibacterium sp.]|uniref:shikimate 5-dehydrogenase n=1 Tax=uncultured Amnibacterium sp. TaxID=1631851 RepID=UPI0035CAFBF1